MLPPTPANRSSDQIASEIRTELRGILRIRRDLYTPIGRFDPISESSGGLRYYVVFDLHERKIIHGLKMNSVVSLKLPDEAIRDRILEFAKAVWHLKDRLHAFAKSTKQAVDMDAIANGSNSLLIVADLANKKKHGQSGKRSQFNPCLDGVVFDTSNSGPVEFFYDGALKEKELIVTNPVPIAFSVSVLNQDNNNVLGDARDIINKAFFDWLPVIKKLGILKQDDPETRALRSILFSDDPEIA